MARKSSCESQSLYAKHLHSIISFLFKLSCCFYLYTAHTFSLHTLACQTLWDLQRCQHIGMSCAIEGISGVVIRMLPSACGFFKFRTHRFSTRKFTSIVLSWSAILGCPCAISLVTNLQRDTIAIYPFSCNYTPVPPFTTWQS